MNLQARYNIAPTTTVDVVIPRGADRLELVEDALGPDPVLVEENRQGGPLHVQRPRRDGGRGSRCSAQSYKRSRCVIPASGYYEWNATPTGKQPYYISAADGSVLSFAGLWDEWHDAETGEPVKSCTIIVTTANAFTGKIHDRMPVVLDARV